MRYLYEVVDLEGNLIVVADNMPLICRCLGVSHWTVSSRLKQRVNKYSDFKAEKYKFNVTRRIKNGNN